MASTPTGHTRKDNLSMPFNYACFISYCHGQYELAHTFVDQLVKALNNEVDVYLDEKVYIDRERLKPGYMFNEKLAEAICESVCMIVIYTPRYKEHTYCLREYTAMEILEHQRLQALGDNAANGEGLIIPIIFRGDQDEPPARISQHRHYCDFSSYTRASEEIARNEIYATKIKEIVKYIKKWRDRLKDVHGPDANCEAFKLPDESQVTWVAGGLNVQEFPR
jgi:hypothetical protein